MMSLSRQSYTTLFVALLASSILCAAGEFSSGLESVLTKPGLEWDYSEGPNGPAHWGELSKEWGNCSEGLEQSPVDVEEEYIQLDRYVDVPAKISYHAAHAIVRGDGKTLEVEWAGGIFNLRGFDFVLEKLVFHSPSEHTYFGERFPLEVQFYHTNSADGVAINSLVFREGESNEWLNQFTASFSLQPGKATSLGVVSADGVGVKDLDWTRYYRYLGSLTTPPCTQIPRVSWSLLKAPLTASREQIESVSAALLNTPNARPIQPMDTARIRYPRFVDGVHQN